MKIQNSYNVLSVIAIAVLTFLQTCGNQNPSDNSNFAKIITDTVTLVTETIVSRTDTVWQTKYRSLPNDTIYLPSEVVAANTHTPLPAINRYEGNQEDSIVDVKYDLMVQGDLLSLELDYKFKRPLFINQVDTVRIEKTNIIEKSKYKPGFYLGGGVLYDPSETLVSISVGGALTLPNRWLIDYNYNIVRSEHSLGLKYRLFPGKIE